MKPRAVLGCLLLLCATPGCGGDSSPIGPARIPLIPVSVRVTPTPIRATLVRTDGTTSTFRAPIEVTFSDVAGAGARIEQLTMTTSTMRTEQGLSVILGMSATTPFVHQLPPGGSLTQPHVLDFAVTSGETLTWSIQASGVDSSGRPFLAGSGALPVVLVFP